MALVCQFISLYKNNNNVNNKMKILRIYKNKYIKKLFIYIIYMGWNPTELT